MARRRGIAHIDVQIRNSGLGLVRNELGRYIPRERSELKNRFMNMAYRAQAEVLTRMSESYVRPLASTGRLERATADRRNRIYSDQGFGVGVDRWLDRSEAKYWRTIEEGTTKFVGMEIRGKFGGAFDWADGGRWGRRARATAPWTIGGQPVQGGYFAAFRKLPPLVIQNPIEPMNAYRDVYIDSGIFDKEAQAAVNDFVRGIARNSLIGE